MTWLLVVAALALPPAPSEAEVRWRPLPVGRSGVLGGAAVELLEVDGDLPLRARCPDGVEPTRRAASPGALVEGPFGEARRVEGRWLLAPGPAELRHWAVPAGCAWEVARAARSGRGHARHERASPAEPWTSFPDPVEPELEAWVGGERSRYLAVRPLGPHPADGTRPRTEGHRVVRPDGVWWRVEQRAAWTVRGPARVRIEARALGSARPLCLHGPGGLACADAGRRAPLAVGADGLVAEPELLDGVEVGARAVWRALVPSGVHALELPGPALVRIRHGDPAAYGSSGPAEWAVHVAPKPAPPIEVVPPNSSHRTDLLFRPGEGGDPGVRWAEPERAERPVDATGSVSVWVTEAGAPCVVVLPGGTELRSAGVAGVSRFLWTGPSPAPPGPVRVSGCAAQVRTQAGPGGVGGGWVATAWVRPGAERPAAWTLDPGVAHSLRLAHRTGQRDPYSVVVDADGDRSAFAVAPLPTPAALRDAGHGGFGPPVALPVPEGARQLSVWVSADVALRVSRPGSDPLATRVEAPAEPRVDAALDPLAVRAEALLEAGYPYAAAADLRQLGWRAPAAVPDALATDVDRAVLRAVAGADQWIARDPAWLPAPVAELDPELVGLAAEGDYLAVAERVRGRADPLRWWRAGFAEGQVPTGSQRLLAYLDLASAGRSGHPWYWPLRATSDWEVVGSLRGAVGRGRIPWPPVPEPRDAVLEGLLAAEPWDPGRVLRFPDGAELRVAEPVALRARCRAPWAPDLPDLTCGFDVLDFGGAVRTSVVAAVDGTPAVVDVRDVPAYVRVRAPRRTVGEVLLPPGLELVPERSAWSLSPGARASFDVLAPTVVRLQTWAPSGAAALRVEAGGVALERAVAERGDVEVPVPGSGPVRVFVQSTEPVWVVPQLRVARGRAALPVRDRLPTAVALAPRTGAPVVAARRALPVQTARPVQRPAVTGVLGLGGGVEVGPDDAEEDLRAGTAQATVDVGVASRPGRAPGWLDGSVGVAGSGEGALASGRVGGDLRLTHGSVRTWLLADAGGATEAGLAAVHGRARLRAEAVPVPGLQVLGSVGGSGRALVVGDGFAAPRVWTPFREEHPWSLEPSAEVRVLPSPWARGGVYGLVRTNALPDAVWSDLARGGLRLELGAPGVWGRAGVRVDRRFGDDHRPVGAWSPELLGSVRAVVWPGRDVGVGLRGGFVHQLETGGTTASVVLEVLASRDRALDDLRPSRTPGRHALAWHQDRAAERRRARR